MLNLSQKAFLAHLILCSFEKWDASTIDTSDQDYLDLLKLGYIKEEDGKTVLTVHAIDAGLEFMRTEIFEGGSFKIEGELK